MNKSSSIGQLLSYVKSYKKDIAVALFALLAVSTSLLSIGLLFRNLVDHGLSKASYESLRSSIYHILILIFIFAIGSFLRSFYINNISEKISSRLKKDVYDSLLRMDVYFFEEIKLGDIISRISSDVSLTKDLVINFLSFLVRNSIMLIGGISFMFIQSPKLALMVMLCVPIILLPLLFLSKKVRKLSKQVLSSNADISAFIEESFSGIKTIFAYNKQKHFSDNFSNQLKSYNELSAKRLAMRSLFFALAISCISITILSVIWVGSIDILEGNMSSGEMISFIYYSIIVGTSAGGVAEVISELQGPLAALDRVTEMINIDQKAPKDKSERLATLSIKETNRPSEKSDEIYFQNINFAYPSRPDINILNCFDLKLEFGKFYGIVGSSGAGKTSLLQLLIKFYDYQSGTLSIGKENIKHTENGSSKYKIAYVSQEPSIFSGTIRFNISFSKPEASEEEIMDLVKRMGIWDFAKNLPKGIDAEIGEKAMRLSGGQKQRIAIARGLLYNPDILLLDEATSALDSKSEKEILEEILKRLPGRTIISIAHRISSIENADDIIVLDKGRVDSRGSHAVLMEKSELYKKLVTQQKIS